MLLAIVRHGVPLRGGADVLGPVSDGPGQGLVWGMESAESQQSCSGGSSRHVIYSRSRVNGWCRLPPGDGTIACLDDTLHHNGAGEPATRSIEGKAVLP